MTQSLTVLGPNLTSKMQAKGQFHVHAAGCGDIKRNYRAGDVVLAAEFQSVQDVVEEMFGDFIGDPYGELGYSPTWQEYLSSETYIAPCVTVPVETPTKKVGK